MKKERIKDIALVLLVVLSLVLTGQIWLNEDIWPDGYNFFSMLQNKFAPWLSPQTVQAEASSSLSPAHMVAYTIKDSDHVCVELNRTNKYYSEASKLCAKAISAAIAQPPESFFETDEDAWKNALYSNGLYIDYGSGIPCSVFCSLFGGGEQASLISLTDNVRYVILTSESNVASSITIYLRSSAGKCYKTTTQLPKKELTDVLNKLHEFVSASNRFSFFIGADTPTSDMDEVLFDSYLLLTENEITLPSIKVQNPFQNNGEFYLEQDKIERTLRCFGMNPKTAKRYTDADENIVYLQNQATLKFTKDGHIEYTAAPGRNGIALSETKTPGTTELTQGSVDLIYAVYGIATGTQPQLQMNDFVFDSALRTIHFDYTLNGLPIVTNLNGSPAATIEINNGCVQRFSILLRTYTSESNTYTVPSSYAAVDRIFAAMDLSGKKTVIEDLFIGYYDNGQNGEKKPTWFIRIEDEPQLKTQE